MSLPRSEHTKDRNVFSFPIRVTIPLKSAASIAMYFIIWREGKEKSKNLSSSQIEGSCCSQKTTSDDHGTIQGMRNVCSCFVSSGHRYFEPLLCWAPSHAQCHFSSLILHLVSRFASSCVSGRKNIWHARKSDLFIFFSLLLHPQL